jgi:hypothetical protein
VRVHGGLPTDFDCTVVTWQKLTRG